MKEGRTVGAREENVIRPFQAEKQAKHLQAEVAGIACTVKKTISGKQVDARTYRQLVAKVAAVAESVDAAQIGVGPRETMRAVISVTKKRLDGFDKAVKAAMAGQVVKEAKNLCQGPSSDFIVHVFNAGSNAKVLNSALKEIQRVMPSTAVMALSLDAEDGKVLCLTQVPEVS